MERSIHFESLETTIYSLTYTNGWSVAAFDAVSGSQRWNQPLDGVFLAAQPVMSGGLIYTSTLSARCRIRAGRRDWRDTLALPRRAPDYVVRNGVLFARVAYDPNAQPPATTGAIYALNPSTGALYWRRACPALSPLAHSGAVNG